MPAWFAPAVPYVVAGGGAALRWLTVRAGTQAVQRTAQTLVQREARRVARAAQVQCCCGPCDPPVGTVMYQIHRVPPSVPHHPCLGDHVHYFTVHQNPQTCVCSKKKENEVDCIDTHGAAPNLPASVVPYR